MTAIELAIRNCTYEKCIHLEAKIFDLAFIQIALKIAHDLGCITHYTTRQKWIILFGTTEKYDQWVDGVVTYSPVVAR